MLGNESFMAGLSRRPEEKREEAKNNIVETGCLRLTLVPVAINLETGGGIFLLSWSLLSFPI